MVYCFVYSLEVVLMCVCMVLFEAFWWRQEEQWTRSWSFFGANENSLRLPSLLLHRPKSFPAKKIPCQTFFPTRHIRRLHTCEAWALNIIISQVCVIWKCYGLLLLSVHAISTKNHMMRIIPEMLKWKLLISYTYFHHHRHYLFFTCSIVSQHIMRAFAPRLTMYVMSWQGGPQKVAILGDRNVILCVRRHASHNGKIIKIKQQPMYECTPLYFTRPHGFFGGCCATKMTKSFK